jgi:anti-sigma factor RsiW
MSEQHVLDWIGAYHDGELRGEKRRWVEAHLETCADCRAELEALDVLSLRLQLALPMRARSSPEQFVAQVRVRMAPRLAPRPVQGMGQPLLGRAWLRQAAGLWVPLGVVALWAWGQAALLVVGVALAIWPGVVPPALPPLPALAGLPLLGVMLTTPAGGGVLALLALDLSLTVVVGGLAWGCLAAWWAARQEVFGSSFAPTGEQAGG